MSTTTTAFSRAAAASRRSAAEPMRWVRDDRFQYLISLLVWILLVLMIVPEGFDYSHLASGVSPVSTGAVSSILWLGLLVGGGVLTVWRGGFVWLLLRLGVGLDEHLRRGRHTRTAEHRQASCVECAGQLRPGPQHTARAEEGGRAV